MTKKVILECLATSHSLLTLSTQCFHPRVSLQYDLGCFLSDKNLSKRPDIFTALEWWQYLVGMKSLIGFVTSWEEMANLNP